MNTVTAPAYSEVKSDFGYGMLAGIIGGACFGAIMQMTGIMTNYAHIVGATQDIDGWFVHIVLSSILGAIYGTVVFRASESWAVSGLAYAIVLWIVGSLIVMPILMGATIFSFNAQVWWALLGNVVFGLVTAGIFSAASR